MVDMDVGPDNKFLSEDSDDESNVVFLRNVEQEAIQEMETDKSDEDMEDGELNEILIKNYELAGLVEKGGDEGSQ